MSEGADALIADYVASTPRSRELHDRLCRVMPAGQTRTLVHFEPYPVVIAEGDGPSLRDLDGNEYVDVLNNYTSLVHGHRHPALTDAVRRVLDAGTVFPAPHERQLDLAELLQSRFPAAERVRFTNSGTEASLLAMRIARAATGRAGILVFEGSYHGSVPEFADGSAAVVQVPYNDAASAAAAIDTSIAAVLVEPFLGSGGVVPAEAGFLEHLRERTAAVGSLLVLDEVQSLRNAIAGVHGELELAVDLVLMGKIIGGGFPVGAVAGRADLLALMDPRRPGSLSHSGTFNGNIATVTAGAVAMRLLDSAAIADLNRRAATLAAAIEAAGDRVGVAVSVSRSGSILQVHVARERPTTAIVWSPESRAAAAMLHLALLVEGVYAAPRGMLNLSTAMTEDHVNTVASAYERAFARVRSAVPIAHGVAMPG